MKGDIILKWILITSSGIVFGTFGVWLARFIARRTGFYNAPNPLVETHKKPVPYLGGAGVFIPFGILLIIFAGFETWVWVFLAGVFVLLVMGTLDDRRPMPWWIKLIVEVVVAGLTLPILVGILGIKANAILIILGAAAIVVLTNGFNIIDVSDGLAGSTGAVVSLGLFAAFLAASPLSVLAATPLLLSCLLVGFFIFNRPKATIYLGDGGSLPLGYAISTLLVIWLLSVPLSVPRVIAALSLVSLIIFEIVLVSWHRIRKGVSIFKGSPDHFALRLVKKGWGVPRILITSVLLTVVLTSSLGFLGLPVFVSWIYLGLLISFYAVSFWWLSRSKAGQ
ncbi:hypothetical protein GF359_09540 [candidate division WOR-3 bacterium]|uniref:Undecaprenyl/decaprenyl-phosphate alpha-N-acetylglucosaminyl 1-phosphate transferase n=1 Tax=candidate division WOR-3 bacterium TaxID=2052148 RepID=A0A9D5QDV7_UNCW3|nr:hypothetical protein [candidate division WOR-3 bacterium]MBD3365441.1 hypothetical protein [candidate division WOR-3 bacterium]